MIELSGFKTADELQNDIQADSDNIYGVIFFKRDDTNFELRERNKKLLDQTKQVANELAPKIDDSDYIYFARVDMSVKENQRLWEKFGLTDTSCDEYPAGIVTKSATGFKIDGPAITSLFREKINKIAGLDESTETDDDATADEAASRR